MTSPYTIPGSVYKLRDGLAVDTLADPVVDSKAMKVTAVICTPAVDRQGEIIVPSGGNYDNYKLNPTVLWEHGFDAQITTPIAKCETPDGQLALRPSDKLIEADAYFSASDKTSSQMFNLIMEKLIRAVSIHVIPYKTLRQAIDGDEITVYPEWSMLEWSWGRLGVNPEAVRKMLDFGKLDGCEILPSIAKSLLPWAAKPRSDSAKSARPPVTRQKAMDNELPPEETPVEETPADEQPADETADKGQQKPSAAYAAAMVQGLTQLLAASEAGLAMIENPVMEEFANGEGRELLQMALDSWNGKLSEVGGKTDESEVPPPDEETMKTFLAGGVGRGSALVGYAAQLETIGTSKKALTSSQVQTLARVAKTFRDAATKAKSVKPTTPAKTDAADDQRRADLVAKVEGVAKTFENVSKDLRTLLPANA